MSAVVRVKRRINEEPLTAFVLNCKKRKLENGEECSENLFETKDEISTVLKFAGTVEYQDEPVVSQIHRITKEDAKSFVSKQRKPMNQTEKMRQEMRDSLHENRFRVVNCYRAVRDTDTEGGEEKQFTVVDIEKDMITTNTDSKSMKTSSNEQIPSTSFQNSSLSANLDTSLNIHDNTTNELPDNYVYDLYLPENDGQPTNFDYMDNYNIRVQPFDDLIYEDGYGRQESTSESEDSNCEDYYKNDYPDSEEDHHYNSVDEDDIRQAVKSFGFGNEGDGTELSTDDEENYNNGFVYSVDSEGIGFEDDLDYCDVNRYGEAYARYKARILEKKPKNYDYDNTTSDAEYESD